eukprot:2177030-Pleurochrysis_carterae.AAC.2
MHSGARSRAHVRTPTHTAHLSHKGACMRMLSKETRARLSHAQPQARRCARAADARARPRPRAPAPAPARPRTDPRTDPRAHTVVAPGSPSRAVARLLVSALARPSRGARASALSCVHSHAHARMQA